ARVRVPVHSIGVIGNKHHHELVFTSPSFIRLSAFARIDSSLERGHQPSMRRAFALVAFFVFRSSEMICFTAGSRSDASRTSQFGNSRAGTLRAAAPMCSFKILAICRIE